MTRSGLAGNSASFAGGEYAVRVNEVKQLLRKNDCFLYREGSCLLRKEATMMAKYAYPAVFTREEAGWSVDFPNLEGCFTCGDTLPEAMEMAEDALALALYDREEDGEDIPPASDLRKVQADTQEIVSLVCCDTTEYRRLHDDRAVEKTLSIPNWLNTLSERAGLNLSAVLREALMAKLEI